MKNTYLITGRFDDIDSLYSILIKRKMNPNLEIDSYGNSTIVISLDSFELGEIRSIKQNNRFKIYISSYNK